MSLNERIKTSPANRETVESEFEWRDIAKAKNLPKRSIKWDYEGRNDAGRSEQKEGSMTISSDMLETAINYLAEIGWDGSIESQYMLVYTAQQQSILRGDNDRVFDVSKWHTFKECAD